MTADPITDALDKLPPSVHEDLDHNFCFCNCVSKREIVNATLNGATTVDAITEQTRATEGPGCCIQRVQLLIQSITEPGEK